MKNRKIERYLVEIDAVVTSPSVRSLVATRNPSQNFAVANSVTPFGEALGGQVLCE